MRSGVVQAIDEEACWADKYYLSGPISNKATLPWSDYLDQFAIIRTESKIEPCFQFPYYEKSVAYRAS
jgi:hypothetical protein